MPAAEPSETSQDLTTGISVTLNCATEGADIYYTLDGTEPTTGSEKYGSQISIQTEEAQKTLKAMAVKEGMDKSDVMSITYTNSAMAQESSAENEKESEEVKAEKKE